MSTTSTSIDICEKLPKGIVPLYRAMDEATTALGIRYLVVGAMARDLVLEHGFDAGIERGTRDVDFGIQVNSWDDFQILKNTLLSQGFRPDEKSGEQRLIGPDEWDLSLDSLDLIPFGGIQDNNANISWPPNKDRVMSVLGFDEALGTAMKVTISRDPLLVIPVASLPGITLLKLIAWTDRAADKKAKDAQDLRFIMLNYIKIEEISDLIYTDGVMDKYDYDADLASAHILGKHAGEIAQDATSNQIGKIFADDIAGRTQENLILDMSPSKLTEPDHAEELLGAFWDAFQTTSTNPPMAL
jgi:predicted nucleotidyltransferase